MSERPHVLLSAAVSMDGYLDDTGPERLVLSSAEDLDQVDEERARSDAVLVGATTLRRDDPRLLVRSAERQRRRVAAGLPAQPAGVVLTGSGELDPGRRFFTVSGSQRLVYAAGGGLAVARQRLAGVVADGRVLVLAGGEPGAVLADLWRRGVRRLMVEGGGAVQGGFLAAGLVDEVRLAVAPVLVGDPAAARFGGGGFAVDARRRWVLAGSHRAGDVVVSRYRAC